MRHCQSEAVLAVAPVPRKPAAVKAQPVRDLPLTLTLALALALALALTLALALALTPSPSPN
jgi:hypothetical protein